MLTTCLACGALIPGGSYCAPCRPRNGSTRKWRGIRQGILRRDGYTCQVCGAEATEVDHIIPVRHGGPDTTDNLRALCRTHNRRKG